MQQLLANTRYWIAKENGASRSALSTMVLFWLISFRQKVLENLKTNLRLEVGKYVQCYVGHFTGGDFFPFTRGSTHKNDILRFGGALGDFRCKFLKDLQLKNNGITAFATTTLEPLTNTRNQPVKITGHVPKQMTYDPLCNFDESLHGKLTATYSKQSPKNKKTKQPATVSLISSEFRESCDICCSQTSRNFLLHKAQKSANVQVS